MIGFFFFFFSVSIFCWVGCWRGWQGVAVALYQRYNARQKNKWSCLLISLDRTAECTRFDGDKAVRSRRAWPRENSSPKNSLPAHRSSHILDNTTWLMSVEPVFSLSCHYPIAIEAIRSIEESVGRRRESPLPFPGRPSCICDPLSLLFTSKGAVKCTSLPLCLRFGSVFLMCK